MIPDELEPTFLNLPAAELCTIVVITGRELRHDRFALRLQSEFPRLVVAWLQVAQMLPNSPLENTSVGGMRKLASGILGRLRRKPERNTDAQRHAEHRLFGEEIERLKKVAYINPTIVPDPNEPETIQFIQSLNPYFILTLGGAIYHKEIRDCARGIALNQHDGWCCPL